MKKLIMAAAFFVAFAATAQDKKVVSKPAASVQSNDNETKYKKLMAQGQEYLNTNNYSGAVKSFSEAMAYNIEPQKTKYYRAFSYYLAMEYDLALKDLNEIIESGGDVVPAAYFVRATTKLGLQDTEGACADLKKAKELGHDVNWEAYEEICEE